MQRSTEILKHFTNVDNRYTIHERVGGGSFGDVFIGKEIDSGKKVAIKFEKKSQYVY
jgi:serine/threonine protein kinase